MNIRWSEQILRTLSEEGVRDIVFCAGARNSPLVMVLDKSNGFILHSFFEERSGAFFALGAARRTGRPVAIVTTSGTAAAELLPAVIEAFHTGVPLICITADRPRRLRGTGAPQAIDQTGLFAKFVAHEFDLEYGEMFSLSSWHRRAPVHLNICFDEPLLDGVPEGVTVRGEDAEVAARVRGDGFSGGRLEFEAGTGHVAKADFGAGAGAGSVSGTSVETRSSRGSFLGRSPFRESVSAEKAAQQVRAFLERDGELLVVVGTLETEEERAQVVEFLCELKLPVYLEGTSGLREHSRLQEWALRSGDRLLAWGLKHNSFSRVLRIGGIPTVRIWRDLEEPTSQIDVMSLTALPFAGLSRGEMVCAEIGPTLRAVVGARALGSAGGWASLGTVASNGVSCSEAGDGVKNRSGLGGGLRRLLAKDREVETVLERLFAEEPQAEPSLVRALSSLVQETSFVYIGNSLPIREWDFAATRHHSFAIEANRGVNGIDGQISTFLGMAREGTENWAVLGDLTTLYDLTGPWALRSREAVGPVRLVVINNGGGKIFTRIFKNDLFENRHELNFSHWAKMWGLGYQRWTSVYGKYDEFSKGRADGELCAAESSAGVSGVFGSSAGDPRATRELIEIVPDNEATRRFWDRYDRLWD